jgi:hypothetical protein
MGDVGLIMQGYSRHLSDLRATPTMAFTPSATPVTKLPGLYIIGDVTGKSACYIGAHGGQFATDYVVDNMAFQVPQGCTVNFYAPAGYSFAMWTKHLRTQQPLTNSSQNDNHYTAGQKAPNYLLSKFAGRHGEGAAAAAQEEDYVGWQQIAGDADVVIVTIRNRWYRSAVTLKTVIADIRSKYKQFTTFNCMFCRVDDSSAVKGNPTWDAGTGTVR